jgi:hypothetical protein
MRQYERSHYHERARDERSRRETLYAYLDAFPPQSFLDANAHVFTPAPSPRPDGDAVERMSVARFYPDGSGEMQRDDCAGGFVDWDDYEAMRAALTAEKSAHAGVVHELKANYERALEAQRVVIAYRDATIADLREKLKEAVRQRDLEHARWKLSESGLAAECENHRHTAEQRDDERQRREEAEGKRDEFLDDATRLTEELSTLRTTCSTLEAERDEAKAQVTVLTGYLEEAEGHLREIGDAVGMLPTLRIGSNTRQAVADKLRRLTRERDEALAKCEGLEAELKETWAEGRRAQKEAVALRAAAEKYDADDAGLRWAVEASLAEFDALTLTENEFISAVRYAVKSNPAPSSSVEPVGLREAQTLAQSLLGRGLAPLDDDKIRKVAQFLASHPANPSAEKGSPSNPVPMVLACPKCGAGHEDVGEWATRPHKTHLCLLCKHEWRPFDYATVGVAPAEKGKGEDQPDWQLMAERSVTEAAQLQARIDELNDGWERIVCREVANAAALRARIDRAVELSRMERTKWQNEAWKRFLDKLDAALTSTEAGAGESAEIPGIEWYGHIARVISCNEWHADFSKSGGCLEIVLRGSPVFTREQLGVTIIPLLQRFVRTGTLTTPTPADSTESRKGGEA